MLVTMLNKVFVIIKEHFERLLIAFYLSLSHFSLRFMCIQYFSTANHVHIFN